MIVIDTNVVSELARPEPRERVIDWLDSLPAAEVSITAVTAAELSYGIARLPAGRRKSALQATIEGLLEEDFRGRVEPFDLIAANYYGSIVAEREAVGRPISVADAQVAAICRKLNAALATRNTKDFERTGLELIDPWQADG